MSNGGEGSADLYLRQGKGVGGSVRWICPLPVNIYTVSSRSRRIFNLNGTFARLEKHAILTGRISEKSCKSWKCHQIRHVAATQVRATFRPLDEKPFEQGRGNVIKMFSPAPIFISPMCVDTAPVFLNTSLDKPSRLIYNGRNNSLAMLDVRNLRDTIERRL